MPAKKRQVEIGVVEHRAANIRIQVFYDRAEQHFHATYAGQRYIAKTEAEVHQAVYAAIEETLSIPWQPVIHILPLSPHFSSQMVQEFIGFKVTRIWVTQFPTGQYKQCQWNGYETDHLLDWCKEFAWDETRDGPFVLPVERTWFSDTNYYLPYSEALWEKLQYMQQKIKELRVHLLSLFGNQQGLEQLIGSFWLALPEPEGVTQEKER